MKNVLATKLLTPLVVIALLAGCKKDEAVISEDVTYTGYNLQMDESTLTDSQKGILAKVNSATPIPFEVISDALLEEHGRNFMSRNAQQSIARGESNFVVGDMSLANTQSTTSALKTFLKSNVNSKSVNIDASFNDMKVQTEALLEQTLGKSIIYNVESNSPMDMFLDAKMQCYSGTVFNQMQFRAGLRKQYVIKNPVVIYKYGHILSGYMRLGAQGWELVGVESTASGRAEILYGATKDLNSAMRIIDAEVFAMYEIFKGRITNSEDVVKVALQQAADKYGIPLQRLEDQVANFKSAAADENKVFLNSDAMMFGNINGVPKGDQTREVLDTRDEAQAAVGGGFEVAISAPSPSRNSIFGAYGTKVLLRGPHAVESGGQVTMYLLTQADKDYVEHAAANLVGKLVTMQNEESNFCKMNDCQTLMNDLVSLQPYESGRLISVSNLIFGSDGYVNFSVEAIRCSVQESGRERKMRRLYFNCEGEEFETTIDGRYVGRHQGQSLSGEDSYRVNSDFGSTKSGTYGTMPPAYVEIQIDRPMAIKKDVPSATMSLEDDSSEDSVSYN